MIREEHNNSFSDYYRFPHERLDCFFYLAFSSRPGSDVTPGSLHSLSTIADRVEFYLIFYYLIFLVRSAAFFYDLANITNQILQITS